MHIGLWWVLQKSVSWKKRKLPFIFVECLQKRNGQKNINFLTNKKMHLKYLQNLISSDSVYILKKKEITEQPKLCPPHWLYCRRSRHVHCTVCNWLLFTPRLSAHIFRMITTVGGTYCTLSIQRLVRRIDQNCYNWSILYAKYTTVLTDSARSQTVYVHNIIFFK